MAWVFGVRYDADDNDISSTPDRYFGERDKWDWDANRLNCRKWESANEALEFLGQSYGQKTQSSLNDWMIRNHVHLEQL